MPASRAYGRHVPVREAGVTPWSGFAGGAAAAAAVLAPATRQSGGGRRFDAASPSRAREEAYDDEVRGRLIRVTEQSLRA